MNLQEFKILNFMNQVTSSMGLTDFSQKIGLTPTQTLEEVKKLAEIGLVKKIGSRYGVTNKGKKALKAKTPVDKNHQFVFYTAVGNPANLYAQNLEEFLQVIKTIQISSLEFHLYRKDFENWIKTIFEDEFLAKELSLIQQNQSKGEELRKQIIQALKNNYPI